MFSLPGRSAAVFHHAGVQYNPEVHLPLASLFSCAVLHVSWYILISYASIITNYSDGLTAAEVRDVSSLGFLSGVRALV